MTSLKKIITGSAVALMIGGTMAATPAAAWGYRHDNGAAIAGAVIGGMALGAAIGAAASQPDYYDGYGYGYGPRPVYGQPYGYAPAPAYGYDYYE
jgi:hypothetical protein